jgi:integrase
MARIEKRFKKDKSFSYRVRIDIKGAPSVSCTFDKLADGKKWASITEAAIREKRYFKGTKEKHSFSDLVERYIDNILIRKPKSIAKQEPQLLWWKKQLGNYNLSEITAAMIVEGRDKLARLELDIKKQRSASTINRYMAVLNHAFNVAIKEWCWLEISPTRNITKLKEPRGRVRYLTDTERQQLLDTILDVCKGEKYPDLYILVILALSTGARKMELLTLKWKDVHLDKNAIILHETKNNEIRRLPLVGKAFELLQWLSNYKKSNDSYVFVSKTYTKHITIEYKWRQVLKKANIKDFRFHDLRHCAASYLAMNGATATETAEILGHKSLQMVSRYSHLSQSHITDVVSSMNNKIFGDK